MRLHRHTLGMHQGDVTAGRRTGASGVTQSSGVRRLQRVGRAEHGASTVEYALLVAGVAVFFLTALVLLDVLGAVFDAGACDTSRGYTCTTT